MSSCLESDCGGLAEASKFSVSNVSVTVIVRPTSAYSMAGVSHALTGANDAFSLPLTTTIFSPLFPWNESRVPSDCQYSPVIFNYTALGRDVRFWVRVFVRRVFRRALWLSTQGGERPRRAVYPAKLLHARRSITSA